MQARLGELHEQENGTDETSAGATSDKQEVLRDNTPEKLEGNPSQEQKEPGEEAPGYQIPYARFKQENSKRKQAEAEIDSLRARLAEAEKRPTATAPALPQRQAPEPSWLDRILDETPDAQDGAAPDMPGWFKPYAAQFEEQRLQEGHRVVDQVIAKAKSEHPDLPEEILLAALTSTKDPERAIDAAVETWDALKERVLGTTKVKPAAPPTLRPAGGNRSPAAPRPKSMAEAHLAMNEWLRTNRT